MRLLKLNTISLLMLLMGLTVQATPAKRGFYTYFQPDGSSFSALLQGDELYHTLTAPDGCCIIQDSGGWYCYAMLTEDGNLGSSGVRVGGKAPEMILNASRSIAHRSLRARAAARRRSSRPPLTIPMSEEVKKSSVKSRKAIIILAQFSDLQFRESESAARAKFEKLINGKNTNSAHDYMDAQFQGEWEFEFTVTRVVTLPKKYSYYGANQGSEIDIRAAEAVAEACRLVDAEVDFSQFDADGDGFVDNVFVFAAGPNEAMGAAKDFIWPHQWSIQEATGSTVTLDGTGIDSYAIATELDGASITGSPFTTIGTFCHEYSHTLGLADLYDTDYEDSEGSSPGLWGLSLMDTGNYTNEGKTPPCYTAVEMWQLGTGICEVISEPGLYTLNPLTSEKKYMKIETDDPEEFYLLECRASSGWDRYIGGSGLVIYHIDCSGRTAGYSSSEDTEVTYKKRWQLNEVNANPSRMAAEVVTSKQGAYETAHVFWPYGLAKVFSSTSQPPYVYHSGAYPSIAIRNISRNGDSVSFVITGPVTIDMTETFQDACIVQWSSEDITGEECIISWRGKGGSGEARVASYMPGKYSYTIEGLDAKSDFEIRIWALSDPKNVAVATVSTKAYYSSGFPFIYLSSTERNRDGSFSRGTRTPLRVYNARNVRSVSWYLDGQPVNTEDDGYYTIQRGGSLKAVLYYENGEKESIVKRIRIR